jgi:hypothetical protein
VVSTASTGMGAKWWRGFGGCGRPHQLTDNHGLVRKKSLNFAGMRDELKDWGVSAIYLRIYPTPYFSLGVLENAVPNVPRVP